MMSQTAPQPFDDAYASLIAACDEALAASQGTDLTADTIEPALQSQIQDALQCIRMLRRRWPRPGRENEDDAESSPLENSRTLGRFEILRELGSGSFGQVFLAHDPVLGRQVALKVPRFDVLAVPELHERFRREAKAAAGLEHPNIVQVFEAGNADNVSYIASAFCPGPTLAAWLKKQTTPVPYRSAATTLAELADGVQHAHSRGVLHRDLKPGNILLSSVVRAPLSKDPESPSHHGRLTTDYGHPKITDFGLAKIESDDALQATQSGAMLGTPQYMAPEQAGGRKAQVGPPADIYALGAILYETLSGRPPFQADSVMELLMLVRDAEPVSLRRLRPGTPIDLETICLKCLQKQPDKRYTSAGELAADLRRFLNGEPIVARPVGWWEQYVKWAKRKPGIAALSASLGVVVLGSVVALTALYVHAETQRQLADYERNEAVDAHQIADKERNEAIDARTRMEKSEATTRGINHFFVNDVVGASLPTGRGLGKDVTLRAALDAAVPKITDTFAGQPEAEAAVADALGRAYLTLGAYDQALPLLEKAVNLRDQILGAKDANTLATRLALAEVTYYLGKYDAAEAMLRQCMETAREIHGAEHPDTLDVQLSLARVLRLLRKFDEAEALYHSAVEVSERTLGPEHLMTIRSISGTADMMTSRGNYRDVAPLRRSIWERNLRLHGSEHYDTLVVQGQYAETLYELKEYGEAEAILRQTLEGRKKVMGPTDPATYSIQGTLAMTLRAQGKLDEAVKNFEETIAGYQKVYAGGHVLIGFMQSQLGECLTELGRFTEAEPLLLQGHETMDKSRVKSPRRMRESSERLMRLYEKWDKTGQAAIWREKYEEWRDLSMPKKPAENPKP